MLSTMAAAVFVFAIPVLIIMMVFLMRRVRRLERRHDQKIIYSSASVFDSPATQEDHAICGCKHHQCFHDENSCGYTLRDPDGYQTPDRTCGCKRYMGPEQLPKVIP